MALAIICFFKTNKLFLENKRPLFHTTLSINFYTQLMRQEIENGDLNFFINKDYSQDVSSADNSKKIMDSIDRLRGPVKLMTKENQDKTMKYIQNLTKLATIYESS